MKHAPALLRALACLLAFASLPAAAQSCLRPPPFSDVAGIGNAGAWQGAAGTDCVLRTNISATTGANLRGSYVKAVISPKQRLRAHFHVDLSQLGTMTGLRSVSLINVVAPAPYLDGQGVKTAALAQLNIIPPRKPSLVVASASAVLPQIGTSIASSQFDVGLEVTVGFNGSVKYWIDAGFDQAPTGTMTVNNAQWASIAGLSIGQTNASPPYLANHAGTDIVFSNIGIDDQLFLSSFE